MRTESITSSSVRQGKKYSKEELIAFIARTKALYREKNNLGPEDASIRSGPLISKREISKYNFDGSINSEYVRLFDDYNKAQYVSQIPYKKTILQTPFPKYDISQWKLRRALKEQKRLKAKEDIFNAFKDKIDDWIQFSAYRIELINLFFWMVITFKEKIEPSYQLFMNKLGCSRKTLERLTDEMDRLSIITKKNRYKQTNIYSANPLIFSPLFRATFGVIFTALSIPLVTLNSCFETPIQIGGVAQTNSNLLNKQQSTVTTGAIDSTNSRVRAHDGEKIHVEMKKERAMLTEEQKHFLIEQLQQGQNVNPFNPILESLRGMTLTLAGKIDLSEFPEDALLHAAAELKKAKALMNPYGFFRSVAKKYCIQHELLIDWSWKKRLKQLYGIQENEACWKPLGNSQAIAGSTRSQVSEEPSSPSERGSGPSGNESIYARRARAESQKGELARPFTPIKTIHNHASPQSRYKKAVEFKTQFPQAYPDSLVAYYKHVNDGTLEFRMQELLALMFPPHSAPPPDDILKPLAEEYENLNTWKRADIVDNQRYDIRIKDDL